MAKNKDNPIFEELRAWNIRIGQVFRHERTSAAVDGAPGIGKTYFARVAAATLGKHYEQVATTKAGLVQALYRYAGADVVGFDDFDNGLRDEPTANVIKMMTAPERRRKIIHYTATAHMNEQSKNPNPAIAPTSFHIRCGLLMMTNLD